MELQATPVDYKTLSWVGIGYPDEIGNGQVAVVSVGRWIMTPYDPMLCRNQGLGEAASGGPILTPDGRSRQYGLISVSQTRGSECSPLFNGVFFNFLNQFQGINLEYTADIPQILSSLDVTDNIELSPQNSFVSNGADIFFVTEEQETNTTALLVQTDLNFNILSSLTTSIYSSFALLSTNTGILASCTISVETTLSTVDLSGPMAVQSTVPISVGAGDIFIDIFTSFNVTSRSVFGFIYNFTDVTLVQIDLDTGATLAAQDGLFAYESWTLVPDPQNLGSFGLLALDNSTAFDFFNLDAWAFGNSVGTGLLNDNPISLSEEVMGYIAYNETDSTVNFITINLGTLTFMQSLELGSTDSFGDVVFVGVNLKVIYIASYDLDIENGVEIATGNVYLLAFDGSNVALQGSISKNDTSFCWNGLGYVSESLELFSYTISSGDRLMQVLSP
eukprot:Phypoly_transcript_05158.p1 GENE.Phypoly_transcript_05158~~Phypoly_transcript_05158.p1  ORF type:complete len:447 (+),score=39.00 Phypoly_transcript_05158:625-1965(+)